MEPIKSGEVRDRGEFRGVGVNQDPFESFRKQRAGAFYTRMRNNDEERKKSKKADKEDDRNEQEYGEYG